MEPSSLLMKMLQSEEGCHKFIGPDQYKAYEDGGNFSIGYGCQQYFDEAGEPYVKAGDVITLDRAQKMLKKGVVKYQNAVEKKLNDNGVVLEQHQKDALTCFCYNIGIGGFNGCDLIKTIISKKNNINGSLAEIKKVWTENWIYYQGGILQGLVNRRNREYKVFAEGGGAYNYNSGDFSIPKVNYEDTDESDALSKKTELQVKYFNTNYCNAVKCVDEVENLGNTIDNMDSLVNTYVPVETMDLTGDKAMYVLLECKRMLGNDIMIFGWEESGTSRITRANILKTVLKVKSDLLSICDIFVNLTDNGNYEVKICFQHYLDFDKFINSFNKINGTNIELTSKKSIDKFNELGVKINEYLNKHNKKIDSTLIGKSHLLHLLCVVGKYSTVNPKDFESTFINTKTTGSFYNVLYKIKTEYKHTEVLLKEPSYVNMTKDDKVSINDSTINSKIKDNEKLVLFSQGVIKGGKYEKDKTHMVIRINSKLLIIKCEIQEGTNVSYTQGTASNDMSQRREEKYKYISSGNLITIL